MSGVDAILEQIQPLVIKLSAEERLSLIHSIAQLEPLRHSSPTSSVFDDDRQLQMLAEQEAWFAKPESQRARYRGRYIAVRHGMVIDEDLDQRTLLRRVRDQFGNAPIPVISGDENAVPEYVVTSPQLTPL